VPVRHRRYGGTPQTALADYIKQNSRRWVEAWLEAVKTDGGTEHYHAVEDTAELIRDTEALYHYLALWLRTANWDPRIDPHYKRIGRTRRKAGFPLNEVIRASLLAKRHLWDGVVADHQLSTALELKASKAIGMFYDRAIYYTIVGYEQDQD
jgi:hypothetical protein